MASHGEQDLWHGSALELSGPWTPAADVYRTAYGWLVKFELAGVRTEDVRIAASGHRLSIEGTRRDSTPAECPECHRLEISYSRFARSLELPCDLQGTELEVSYENGMLLVRLRTGPAR
jgi:HSP20 family protein